MAETQKTDELLSEESSEYEDYISSEEELKKKDERSWTRVWNPALKSGPQINIYEVNEDLRRVRDLSKKKSDQNKAKGTLIWSPTNFSKDNKDFDIETERVPIEKLKEFGILATQLRKEFYEKSDRIKMESNV